MKRYADLLVDAQSRVREIQPWDLASRLAHERAPLLLDVREPAEFTIARIPGSVNVPRGVLEQACEWDYEETVPDLAARRTGPVVVVCRSGNRSLLAADAMLQLGFVDVVSLKTGVRLERLRRSARRRRRARLGPRRGGASSRAARAPGPAAARIAPAATLVAPPVNRSFASPPPALAGTTQPAGRRVPKRA